MLSFPSYSAQELKSLDTAFRLGDLRDVWTLGDIVISMPTLNRQRVEYGFSEKTELARLYIHGLVHLFGYDHELSLQEARRMQRVERYLLTPPGKLR